MQIAQAQGKDITGQSIFQLANQIANNPNGIFTQLILQLVKQDTDDGGKNGHTVKIIKTVVKGDGGSSNSNNNQQSSNKDTGTRDSNIPNPIQILPKPSAPINPEEDIRKDPAKLTERQEKLLKDPSYAQAWNKKIEQYNEANKKYQQDLQTYKQALKKNGIVETPSGVQVKYDPKTGMTTLTYPKGISIS